MYDIDEFDFADVIVIIICVFVLGFLGLAFFNIEKGKRPEIIRAIDEYEKGNPVVHVLGDGVGISFQEGTNSYVIDFTPQEINYFKWKQQVLKDKENEEKLTQEQKKTDILKTVLDENPIVESYKK